MKRFTYTPSFSTANLYSKKSFSEIEIIRLQKIFLTPGFHVLQVRDMLEGRKTIETFLHSLNCYTNVACLSIESAPLRAQVFDVFYGLTFGGYIHSYEHTMEQFFIDHFTADFIWIEATPNLLNQAWSHVFKYHLENYNIRRSLPVITLEYR